jgi:hypothetical protein
MKGSTMSYDSYADNLTPLTEIADGLGLVVRKQSFDDDYIPIEMVAIKDLYSDSKYQRLLNRTMIKKAGAFDASLCRPLAVFERPDGKKTIDDGQHTATIGYLYTNQAENLHVPCQVIRHPKDRSLEDCIAIEAKYFEDLNKNRTNVGAIEALRSGIAYGNKDALEKEQKLITMGVHIQQIGDTSGYEVSGFSRVLEAYNVGKNHSTENPNGKYAIRAVETYAELIEDKGSPNWSESSIMLGSVIAGLAKVWYLRDMLGRGDRGYVVQKYLEERLKNTSPKSLHEGTHGNYQSDLIAIRIVNKINTLIEESVLTKRDGTKLKHEITEDALKGASITDQSKMK